MHSKHTKIQQLVMKMKKEKESDPNVICYLCTATIDHVNVMGRLLHDPLTEENGPTVHEVLQHYTRIRLATVQEMDFVGVCDSCIQILILIYEFTTQCNIIRDCDQEEKLDDDDKGVPLGVTEPADTTVKEEEVEGDETIHPTQLLLIEVPDTLIDSSTTNFQPSFQPLMPQSKPKKPVYPCDHCDRTFTRLGNQQKHNDIIHATSKIVPHSFICDICNRSFKIAESLETHRLTQHCDEKKRNDQCRICNMLFKNPYHLRNHIERVHLKIKSYQCDICLKSFNAYFEIKAHIKKHLTEKLFSCHLCPKKFKWGNSLRMHLRSHNGDRVYHCSTCQKTFLRHWNLSEHVKQCVGNPSLISP